jgi:hypothetical protein
MGNLSELEKQYNEAKKNKGWKQMAAIMLKVYPEHKVPLEEVKEKK